MYVKKTENASLNPFKSKATEPSSYFKGKALVQGNGSSLSLRFVETPLGVPKYLDLPHGIALKEGQSLEVALRLIKGKWQVEIPHSELYEDLTRDSQSSLNENAKLLLKMGLAPAGREFKLLEKFFSPSLWGRRLLAMGILDKRCVEDLALLNAFSVLTWGEYSTQTLKDLLCKPFKSRKNGGLDWYIIPLETLLGEKKIRASLNLGFQAGNTSQKGLALWSFIFPLGEDWLILQAREGSPRILELTFPTFFHFKERSLEALKKLSEDQGWGILKIFFEESPQKSIDPWEEDFS